MCGVFSGHTLLLCSVALVAVFKTDGDTTAVLIGGLTFGACDAQMHKGQNTHRITHVLHA